jgi:hypothetical protein
MGMLCRAALSDNSTRMVTLTSKVGLLSLLESQERELIERKLRKHFHTINEFAVALEEEVAELQYYLDDILQGRRSPIQREDDSIFG